ncbi:hypothetical protein EV641_106173 [Rhodococcus sp. SMB37]|uniref:hypothetical protein n=1 Tax=Rhodococcus sp. SMB37 TaxID=2512213 RepID=UPI0010D55D97|nr:hypothetical protein [Rhodococcus sp. SMB37]TCN53527.1 hypothetical protein EV641_106173 [Rhodococcus sp. SMB37]
MPLSTLGAAIAALTEVAALTGTHHGPGEPAAALSLISTLGVLTRNHDNDLPVIGVPESLVMRAIRLVANTADLVHRGCPLPAGVAEDVRPHLHQALEDDVARLRALLPRPGRRPRAVLWAVPDTPS